MATKDTVREASELSVLRGVVAGTLAWQIITWPVQHVQDVEIDSPQKQILPKYYREPINWGVLHLQSKPQMIRSLRIS